MTTSTLNYAARSFDSALEAEHNKLEERRQFEKMLREDYNRTQDRARELSEKLTAAGQQTQIQEQRVAEVEQALAIQAEAVLEVMGKLDLKPLQAPVSTETAPDPLGVGQVPTSEAPVMYDQQVAANGQPPTVTQPVPAVAVIDDPGQTQHLPSMPVSGGREVVQTNPDATSGDTTMLRFEGGKKVASRRGGGQP